MSVKIQFRRDTSTNWASTNPTPAQGEPCFETDTNKWKIGDGTTAYNSLPYFVGGNVFDSISVDTISEKTSANGVIIDGVTLKDGVGSFKSSASIFNTIETTGTGYAREFFKRDGSFVGSIGSDIYGKFGINGGDSALNQLTINSDGIVNMPNQSSVSAYNATSQTITNQYDPIVMNTGEIDTQGEWDGQYFSPKVTGKYLVTFSCDDISATNYIYILIDTSTIVRVLGSVKNGFGGGISQLVPFYAGRSYRFSTNLGGGWTITNSFMTITRVN